MKNKKICMIGLATALANLTGFAQVQGGSPGASGTLVRPAGNPGVSGTVSNPGGNPGVSGTVTTPSATPGVNGSVNNGDGTVKNGLARNGIPPNRAARTNQFGVVTNLGSFNSNSFGIATNNLSVLTNQGRYGFGGTNGYPTPTSNRGTNRFYGTNTFHGTNQSASVFRDQAVTPAEQALLSQIRQTVSPQLGITSADNSPIHFTVRGNTVIMTGTAVSADQNLKILSMVRSVPGVWSVRDNLTIGAASGINNSGGTIGVSARSVDGIPSQISLNPSGTAPNSPLEQRLNLGTNGVTGSVPIGDQPIAPEPPVAPAPATNP